MGKANSTYDRSYPANYADRNIYNSSIMTLLQPKVLYSITSALKHQKAIGLIELIFIYDTISVPGLRPNIPCCTIGGNVRNMGIDVNNQDPACMSIQVLANDPVYGAAGLTCMAFSRSAFPDLNGGPRQAIYQ